MITVSIWYQSNPHSRWLMIKIEKIGFPKEFVAAGAELPGPRYSQYLSLFALQ